MEITSLSDLLSEIMEIRGNQTELWFRGQSNANYKLIPSIIRTEMGLRNENAIFETYRKFAQKLNPGHNDEWELLIDMQHYFVPTRLLDWSESLMIALFFATMGHNDGEDAGLFILDPIRLNQKSGKNGIPNMPFDKMGLSYKEAYIEKIPFPAAHPIAIKSSYLNDRVMAQRGMFTVHTDRKNGLEEEYPDVVKKYCISDNAIAEIKDLLYVSNINESTVFPDFYGVANYIKDTLV